MTTRSAIVSGVIILLTMIGQPAAGTSYLDYGEEPKDDASRVINRPANIQGLTGLIFTNSAYTQPKGRIVVGLASIGENSSDPNFSIAQGFATITAGITDRIEIGIRAQAIGTNFGSSKTRETGFGDTDVLVKWRISSEYDPFPAIALGVAYTFPTGDSAKGYNDVEDYGLRFMVIGTAEKEMPGDYFIGVYFEGQVCYKDKIPWTDGKSYSEKYGVVNAGLLFPLTESRKLQAMFEYTTVVKKNIPTVNAENSTGFMPGLRYVTENANISVGVQFYHREEAGFNDTLRYVGTLSYAF
ncbi:MAG: hypothetical protein HGA43_09875 [Nitrospirae bacterium]|nr:hypothetical protein [Nitrospirota bacterium]